MEEYTITEEHSPLGNRRWVVRKNGAAVGSWATRTEARRMIAGLKRQETHNAKP